MYKGNFTQDKNRAVTQEFDFLNTCMLTERLLTLETEAASLRSELMTREFGLLQKIPGALERLSSLVSEIKEQQAKQSEDIEYLKQRINCMEPQVNKTAVDVSGVSASVTAISQNLNALRNLTDRLVEQSKSLSVEFIDRYVKGPFLEHVGSVYNSIRQLDKQAENGEFSALLDEVRMVIDGQGGRIVEPEKGERVDLKAHTPIRRVPTQDKDLNMKICEVLKSGVGINGATLKNAIVSVFCYNKDAEESEERREKNQEK